MSVFVVAVVIVGLLGLVNLLFSFGVIRRMREHTETLDDLARQGGPVEVMLGAGEVVADFDARTVDGAQVSRDGFADTTLVGVFSPGCSACEAQLDEFVEHAMAHPGGRRQVLALVVDEEADSGGYVSRLEPVSLVVRERRYGPVYEALAVRGFPAFALVEGGVVLSSGFDLSALSSAVGR
ncbi:hypothetical protein J4573_02300 [Actinomadura barringtoniae]|uniref:Thioredoxin domain-containing protein n=1 Tax=Actinomadura barringtoniae TaxID=1427535 RepID=A0A939P608_9ACTN|nr:hypothetical protein [Actinomadura barringtoniae]MBO2445910.1 hypothetical protein [Actinomadura barringtoniae]